MMRIRYAIVDHPAELDGTQRPVGNQMENTPPVHPHMLRYHWTRMDDNTIFVKGWYNARHHDTLTEHPSVTLLPPTFSRQTVKTAIHKQGTHHHHHALTKHPVPFDDHTITADLVDWMAENESEIFGHEV